MRMGVWWRKGRNYIYNISKVVQLPFGHDCIAGKIVYQDLYVKNVYIPREKIGLLYNIRIMLPKTHVRWASGWCRGNFVASQSADCGVESRLCLGGT